ncbi:Ankyrin repeat domain-containing protein 34B [Hondaea fermentalgiana]|uniref:Ankyrin repeat domain-containing protein 34B n=1 Tax=Hondaea fermentalgiana TaxID=2315210 RepID=A0A2R5GXR9_9STRA|nr:Ankyrin repeat domain-containing protein 34B [Hondaea fermentalgiana]|eukprot:GBG35119.1 Ankyrin repeat domain-containing protein 34B [Hondaea fermentalgiana]
MQSITVANNRLDALEGTVRMSQRMTAVLLAMFLADLEYCAVAQWLIERGAKLDLQDNGGWVALMTACRYEQPDTNQLLIERGAKLDLQNNNGYTALMVACQQPKVIASHRSGSPALHHVLCYAAGADLDLKIMTRCSWPRKKLAPMSSRFWSSRRRRRWQGDLQQPRSLVVTFYEEGLRSKRMYSVLQDVDPQSMSVTSSLKRRMIANEFNPNAAHVPQKSLPRRVSRQLVRITGIYKFLTHDWGEDDANHEVVSSVNAKLRHANRVTWFVEDRPSYEIVQQITQGIGNSCNMVVYITERCMDELQSDNKELINIEFLAVTLVSPG